MRIILAPPSLFVILLISGCSSLSGLQKPLEKFNESTHEISSAQLSYLSKIHATECTNQFYRKAFDYSTSKNGTIILSEGCKAENMFLSNSQIQTRKDLMETIALYTEKLETLSSPDEYKELNSSLLSTASGINSLAKTNKLSDKNKNITTFVESAIVGLTNFVLDHKRINDIKTAALSQQSNLTTIVSALKHENIDMAHTADILVKETDAMLSPALNSIRKKNGPDVMFYVIMAHNYVQEMSPFGLQNDSTTSSNLEAVVQLNKALDGIVSANNAIAASSNEGVIATVNDLAARAKAVQEFQSTLAK